MSNKRDSILDLYEHNEESYQDAYIKLLNKHNKLMEEFTSLYKKYKHKNEKCKELEERESKHFENFLKENPHLHYLIKPKPKSHWNLS